MQLQFELWEECNSGCKFCYLGANNRFTSDDIKLSNINQTIDAISINNLDENVDCLGYIGGEFFQGQLHDKNVKNAFMKLIDCTNHLLISKRIHEVWISASLLIGDQHDLYECLSHIDDKSKLWILTSYDTMGRFHSASQYQHWVNCIHQLKSVYPEINVNITSIVTGDFIDHYLQNDLSDLTNVLHKYKCALFLKPTCIIGQVPLHSEAFRQSKHSTNSIVPNFFPTRSQMLKFLTQYHQYESSFDYNKLFNITYRADYLKTFGHRYKLAHREKDTYNETFEMNMQDVSNVILPIHKCHHSRQYQCYVDSDECLICDKQMVDKMT